MQKRVVLVCIAVLGLTTVAWPQASSSTVRGIVRDQAEAVVPNAKVTLTNTATNVSRETTTNDAGLYVFPGVIPGPYRLVGDFAGMQRFEGTLTVQVQQQAGIIESIYAIISRLWSDRAVTLLVS